MKSLKLRFSSTLILAVLAPVLVLSIIFSVFGLRQNNLRVISLREAVVTADKAYRYDQDEQISLALSDLRSHVIRHMNADLGQGPSVIQLPHKYYHDAFHIYYLPAAKALNDNQALALLNKAGNICQAEIETAGIGCIQEYINDNPREPGVARLKPVVTNINLDLNALLSQDLYRFSYSSPGWSPDLAGISIATAISSAIGLVLTLARRLIIRRRNRSFDDEPEPS